MEVEGAGEMTPSPAKVQVVAVDDVGEYLHLPQGQALVIV